MAVDPQSWYTVPDSSNSSGYRIVYHSENNEHERYLKLFRATETAINILIQAQRECEEMYLLELDEPETRNLSGTTDAN